ncbi:crossover junction endodeoxyribonuclease RuvC [Acidobacteria bacterium ACD]|nr:MAG: crossover junction endodeoxyribonuclease RuvC [Acidobacteriota bacterium]MDL1951712.1 crossover junction endodeoxyribonuclease RuvC [Acidobacteria bacterium ACD]
MRVLGVDPGSRATGWAVVSFDGSPSLGAAGVLRPPAGAPLSERLRSLHAELTAVIARERPDTAAVERVFSGRNPQSLITLGEARGVLLLALASAGVPTAEITPAEVKRAITGAGAAEKEQVRRMVLALLPGASSGRRLALDAADAAAIALAWGYRAVTKGARLRPARTGLSSLPEAGPGLAVPWRRRPSG